MWHILCGELGAYMPSIFTLQTVNLTFVISLHSEEVVLVWFTYKYQTLNDFSTEKVK